MDADALRELGFTDNETRVYIELLKREDALASDLADKTGVNRTLVYQILHRLIKKGLVSYVIKNNAKYFKAAHPDKLISFLKEKEHNIQKLIPELLNLKAHEEKKYSVELYEGTEGLKTILNDVVRTKPKEFLDMTSGKTVIILPRYLMEQWHRKRINANIKARLLYNRTSIGIRREKEMSLLPKTEARLLPPGLKSPSHIYIYGDNVAITLWEKEIPFGIIVHSKEMAERFTEFFDWFWKFAKK
ncbi:MAG: helix-turn-helix domain-containing protein [Nanoarchaeota archaeon]|nr:helix-turn-helix domain-containing protein [Nanoarchaeota archaeon]